MKVVKRAIESSALLLARLGIIDEERGKRVADLAWPRVVTGVAQTSKTTADLAMVGMVIGPAAIAGMGFAFAYWFVATTIAFSLANGAMTFMSQRVGADDEVGLDLVIKQTILVELAIAVTIASVFVAFADRLIGLLGAGPEALAYGTLYLQIAALAILFESFNLVASRALLSANDAWSPMVVRGSGALANIGLNALFIFGFGLGVAGAALGTVLATMGVALCFGVGMVGGNLPGLGSFPVRIRLGRPYVDRNLLKQLLEVATPLVMRRLVDQVSNLVMLAIVAYFGTVVVAAYAVSREIRRLLNTPTWGFGAAARSLVGQALGGDDEEEAESYGWDVLRFAIAVYAVLALGAFAFAGEIASVFADSPEAIAETTRFIRVIAVALLGLGVDGAVTGTLSAGGDTRWPLYGRLVGLYVFMIPIAYLGVISPLGMLAIYLAIVAENTVPAAITFTRFKSGKWLAVSRRYRTTPAD